MEFVGHSGSLIAKKETDAVEGGAISKETKYRIGSRIGKETYAVEGGAISKKGKRPRDVAVGSSPVSKKAKFPKDVGGPSSGFAQVPDRIAAAAEAATAARFAYNRSHVTLLAEYLELRSITKKHIKKIQSSDDKDEISRAKRLLVEIGDRIKGICSRLGAPNLVRVYTVSELMAVRYMIRHHAWVGKAAIIDEEADGPELMAVTETAKKLKIPLLHCVKVKKNEVGPDPMV